MNILLEDSEHEELCGERTDPGRMGRIVSDAIASGKALMNGESYFVEQDNLGGDYTNKEDEIFFDYCDDTLFQSFELPVLNRPYNRAEVVRKCTAENRISGIVRVSLCDLLEKNWEGFLDQLNEELVGDIMLSDLRYKVVGHKENDLFTTRISPMIRRLMNSTMNRWRKNSISVARSAHMALSTLPNRLEWTIRFP